MYSRIGNMADRAGTRGCPPRRRQRKSLKLILQLCERDFADAPVSRRSGTGPKFERAKFARATELCGDYALPAGRLSAFIADSMDLSAAIAALSPPRDGCPLTLNICSPKSDAARRQGKALRLLPAKNPHLN